MSRAIVSRLVISDWNLDFNVRTIKEPSDDGKILTGFECVLDTLQCSSDIDGSDSNRRTDDSDYEIQVKRRVSVDPRVQVILRDDLIFQEKARPIRQLPFVCR